MKKKILYQYIILSLRWYLAIYMFEYGFSKMFDGQFQVHSSKILNQPLKEVDSFYVAWHLFGRSTFFKISVGLTQCLGAILLIINRTKLLGAFILLPVIINIFIIDVSFTMGVLGWGLPLRMFMMVICNLIIIYNYKEQIITVFKTLIQKVSSDLVLKWWWYPILFIIGFLMDFIIGIITLPIKFLLNYLSGM